VNRIGFSPMGRNLSPYAMDFIDIRIDMDLKLKIESRKKFILILSSIKEMDITKKFVLVQIIKNSFWDSNRI
jgi:hypothetical protein